MVFFNYALRKLNAKIVYYGPGLCGKTTNLQWIHDNFQGGDKGKMVSLATEGDRTIFFDLLPLDIGTIRGMDVTLQLYTVPGQVHYNSTRQLVLRGADGVVFVADSQRAMQTSNTDSLKNLVENMGLQGFNLAEFPHIIQFNKRDLGDLMTVEEMDGALNRFDAPFFESVAVEGIGIQESLEGIVRLVMRSLKDRYEARGIGAEPSRIKPVSAGGPRPLTPAPGSQAPSGPIPLGTVAPPTIPAVPIGEGLGSEQALEPPASDVKPVSFEEIDTQTEVLVPPVPPDVEASGSDPADRLPTGPGKPVETADEDIKVAQYDTADVEEVQDSVPDDPGAPPEETVVEPESTDLADFSDVVDAEISPDPPEWDEVLPVDRGEEPAFKLGTVDSVDDLMASVIRAEKTPSPAIRTQETPSPAAKVQETSGPAIKTQETPSPAAKVQETSGPAIRAQETEGPAPDPSGWSVEDVPAPVDQPELLDAESAGEPEDVVPAAVHESATVGPPPLPSTRAAVVFDDRDPFSEEAWDQAGIEPPPSTAVVLADDQDQVPISVSAGDNSLALKLTGTGAIVESGQVRALDIEVPVPGTWVGNRRVTLQLRLTLLPITEDENDGTTGPS